jgi:multiple sugar transport system ATP-binding protein
VGQVGLDRVTKRFGSAVAVNSLSLNVEDGEFFVLLGPSGCGKSTVLRLIAGLEEPTEGTISIAGERVDGIDPRDRNVAMVFQSYALYPHMTVRRNIEFPLRTRGSHQDERDALVHDVARLLDLDGLLDRKPSQLSGGQRQRVALARAIVRRPLVFLMDEPLSNLDAKLRVQTRAQLVELHQRLATTIIFVTHDQVEAMTMGERIAVLNAGSVQQVGPPQQVYDRPANLFVARFIGSPPMNTVATPLDSSEVLRLQLGDGLTVPSALEASVRAAGLTEVVVGVRPEDLTIDPAGAIPATVAMVESLGHERHVACRLADGTLWMATIRARDAVPAMGDTIRLRVDPEHLHLFDPATEARIG